MDKNPPRVSQEILNAISARKQAVASLRTFHNSFLNVDNIVNRNLAIEARSIALSYDNHLERVTQSLASASTSAVILNDSFLNSLARSVAVLEKAILPDLTSFQRQSATIGQALQLRQEALASISAIDNRILASMSNLNTAYILPEFPRVSMFGFGSLAALSNTVQSPAPFTRAVSETVAEAIGQGLNSKTADDLADPLDRDSAAIEAGLQVELIAFPPSGYSEVMYEASFRLIIPHAGVDSATNNQLDSNAVPSAMYYELISRLENHMRDLIVYRLTRLAGEKWIKQRVPEDIRKEWMTRIGKERSLGRAVRRPIDYADFSDLMDIICRRDNWRDEFHTLFENKNDLQASFVRLIPVRNAIAHSRPLSRSDALILTSECTRLLVSLGLVTLH